MNKIYSISINKIKSIDENVFATLCPSRLAKAKKYVNKNDYYLCLGVGYLLHEILKIKEDDIYLSNEGKPLLKNNNQHISISHSKDFSILAISDYLVGIDIENLNRKVSDSIILAFAKDEQEFLSKNKDCLIDLWTLKESFLKCIGKGLSFSFSSFSMLNSFLSNEPQIYQKEPYFTRIFTFNNEYKIAVTCRENVDFEFEEIK